MRPGLDETHDPERSSWVVSAQRHPAFPIQNLPLGIFSSRDERPRIGVAIGESILDLSAIADTDLIDPAAAATLNASTLNALFALPPTYRRDLRRHLSAWLSDPAHRLGIEPLLVEATDCTMHLPVAIGDYTDFYAGIHHAENVGRQFRPDAPLLPNYKYVPVGYHGRSSSVQVSGTSVIRPNGQSKLPDAAAPRFGPAQKLDYEVELGIWIGAGNTLGERIPIAQAGERIVGLCLLNDWSARDLQAWEYQPLGPFLAKNFLTSVSPWVVTREALTPFRIPQPSRPEHDPQPLPYLWDEADQRSGAFAIEIALSLLTPSMRDQGLPPQRLSRVEASTLYWTMAQLIAHHTSGGCNLNPGDLLGTGTLSGPRSGEWGSLLEITAGGQNPLYLADGERRRFLEDGDEVIMTATAQATGAISIGFGECRGRVSPARQSP